ncbi:MAG TPA: DJ-1/PfpI family protein [Terriglobales bacterium]|nr:DJ-1/PfpI family protein [Terriglobales bacterium]
MKIRILVFDGADELDFVAPWEIFRRAARVREDVDVTLVTLDHQPEVKAAAGLRVIPDAVLDDAVDVLVVPGGGYVGRAARGVRAQIADGRLPRKIAELKRRGAMLAGVCSGAMILSAAGLLDGRAAVTHHDALADLRKTAANVIEARVVDDGDIVTCGGVTSSLDLALWLTERFWGAEIATRISADLEYTRSPDVCLACRLKL